MSEIDDEILYDIDGAGEEEPLYSIPDEEDAPGAGHGDEGPATGHGEDDLPYAYGQEDPGNEEETADGRGNMQRRSSLLLLCGVMLWPATGWKDLKRSRRTPEAMASMCFLPLAALAALSLCINFVYQANQTAGGVLLGSVVIFMAYVFSYFLLPVLGRPFLDAKVNESLGTPFGKCAVMLLLSTLAMFRTLFNLLPGLDPVIVFMPIWTVYLTYRLTPMLRAPKEKAAMTTAVLSILTLGLPQGWMWLLEKLF